MSTKSTKNLKANMKILIDVRPLMDKQYSGIGEYIVRLLAALFALDRTNEYVLFYNSLHDCSKNLPDFNQPNVRYASKRLPNKILNYGLLWFLGWPKLDKWFGGDFDIVFLPHINFAAVSSKTKTLLTVHDLSFLVNPEFFSWRKNIWHWFVNVKRLASRAFHIVAVSEHTKADLVSVCNTSAEKVTTIYAGFDESFKPIAADDAKLLEVKHKYQLNKPFILFLATLEPRKNIEGLIKAFEILKKNGHGDLQLVLAGGRGWRFGSIDRAIKNSPVRSDIILLDYVPASERVYLYNLAKVFAYPSLYEGFGFPPLEAMACGTPVVASATSSLPEIIGTAGVLVDPYNPSAIALAIEQILSNKTLADELIEKGLVQAKKFSWRQTAQKYLELFENICR